MTWLWDDVGSVVPTAAEALRRLRDITRRCPGVPVGRQIMAGVLAAFEKLRRRWCLFNAHKERCHISFGHIERSVDRSGVTQKVGGHDICDTSAAAALVRSHHDLCLFLN